MLHASAGGHAPGPIPSTLADYLCIDFVNSRFTDHTGSGAVYDRLDLAAWRRWVTARWGVSAEAMPDPGELRDLRSMRNLVRRLLTASTLPGTADVVLLNRFLHRSVRLQQLVRLKRSLEVRQGWSVEGWPAVMAAVAESYLRLVQNGDARRVRVCANPHCSWLFHDVSHAARRRWCDVAVCGNLLRVQQHRARVRGAPSASSQVRRPESPEPGLSTDRRRK